MENSVNDSYMCCQTCLEPSLKLSSYSPSSSSASSSSANINGSNIKSNNSFVSLFSVLDDFDGYTLADLLKLCCDIEINMNDRQKYLCEECTTTLLITYKFRVKAQEAQRILVLQDLQDTSGRGLDSVLPSETPTSFLSDIADDAILGDASDISLQTLQLLQQYGSLCDDDFDESRGTEEISPPPSNAPTVESSTNNSADNSGDDEIINYVLPIIRPKNSVDHSEQQPTIRLKRKSRRSVKETPINYKCKQCGAGFFILKNLVAHLTQVHGIQEKYTCRICEQGFTNVDAYLEHQNSHEVNIMKEHPDSTTDQENKKNDTKKMFKCTHCPKSFLSKSSLQAHVRVHTGERPFQCTKCDKHFKTVGALELHERRHAGIKPYVCTYCGKSFVESSNLKVHVRSHTNEKPHICVHCGRGFSRVFLLQIHTRTHTGERPFKCDHCDKAFSQRGDLKSHKKIHTNDRPFICELCGKRFIKNSSLNQHKRNHKGCLGRINLTDSADGMVSHIHMNEDNMILPIFETVYNNSRH